MKEKKVLNNFIKNIGEKNYSQANKYLEQFIDSKIKSRIRKAANKPLF